MGSGSKKVWIIGLTILVVLALFGFMQSSVFNLKQIDITGNQQISRNDLLNLANVGLGTNIFKISTEAVAKNIGLHPLVKSVTVTRRLPNTLLISIVERKPVAMIPVPNGFVKVDDQGIFLMRSDTWPKESLPVISGIQLPSNLNLGQPIPNSGLIEGLKILMSLPPELYPMVGELSAADRDKLILYTRDGLEIRLGEADQAAQKFAVLREFLLDKNYKPFRVGYYVDLTTGQPVLGRR